MQTTAKSTESAATVAESAVQPLFVERRRGLRHQFTATVELVDIQSRTKVQARTSDLSLGGCYVDTTSPLPADVTVKMRLTRDKRSFEVQARVAYSLAGMGMGMAFTKAAPDQLEVLKRWIGELTGELPPELSASDDNGQAFCGPRESGHDPSYVLGALVMELVRQGVLPHEKGKSMLSQLMGSNS